MLFRSPEAVETILKTVPNGKILEVGAGTGYWARCIAQMGGNIVATDNCSWDFHTGTRHYPVEQISAVDAVKKYNDCAMLMSWPPYGKPMGADALKAFLAHSTGQYVFYIGEGMYGCTGDDEMHEIFETRFRLCQAVDIPNWGRISDALYIYKRK